MQFKAVLACLLLLASARVAFSSPELLNAANEVQDWIVEQRRALHRIPELKFDLPKTTAAVRAALDDLKIPYTYPVGKSGIVATVGRGDGAVVGLRADMDALPITEETDLDFASEPAEEVGRGAKDMLKSDQLKDVAAMFGFHVWPSLESGLVATRAGLLMGEINMFEVTVTGKGGHASMPHLTTDPYIPVSNMILAYQSVISRRQPPWNANVISVTKIRGGEAFNVIPDSVTFGGTMRSLQPNGLKEIVEEFTSLTQSIAEAYGCTAEVTISMSGDAVINHPDSTAFAMDTAKRLFGDEKVIEAAASTAAEDFAYFGKKIPATFIFLGIRNETAESTSALHTPKFRVDETILSKGAALHAALAMEYLKDTSMRKTEL